jgi:hypothetical protein
MGFCFFLIVFYQCISVMFGIVNGFVGECSFIATDRMPWYFSLDCFFEVQSGCFWTPLVCFLFFCFCCLVFFFFFPNRFAKLDIIAILPCLKFAHD